MQNEETQEQENSIENLIKANEDQPGIIGNIPNPATEQTAIYYNLGNTSAIGEIVTTNIYGAVVARHKINGNTNKIDIDCSELASGIYFNTLFVEQNSIGTKKMVVVK